MTAPSPLRAGTNPADDPVGTVRVHPADDPRRPDARRAIATDEVLNEMRWDVFSGSRWVEGIDESDDPDAGYFQTDEQIAAWPVQPWWHLAAVLSTRDAVQVPVADLDREYAAGETRGHSTGDPRGRWDEARAALCAFAWFMGGLDAALVIDPGPRQ